MTELPIRFKERMKELLGEEFKAFEASYDEERVQGLRFNSLKDRRGLEQGWEEQGALALAALAEERAGFALRKIPWVKEGYYYEAGSRPGKHPYHEAGLYYIQEPSAMAVVELLDPKPGECILDLCAAPGGKSTHIASRLKGRGLLLSNEIHPARARVLSQNLERMGVENCVASSEDPARLEPCFPEFFHRIVVDAPCSGEGMFRKDEAARQQWSEEHVAMCAVRQGAILDHGAAMLRPGGRLVYSTCTFAPEENEQTILHFLERHREFEVEPVAAYEGFASGKPQWAGLDPAYRAGTYGLEATIRMMPHKLEGEGHFIAVLKKAGGEGPARETSWIREAACTREAACIREAACTREASCTGEASCTREASWIKEPSCTKALAHPKAPANPKKPAHPKAPVYLNGRKREELLKGYEKMLNNVLVEPGRFLDREEYILFGEQLYLLPPGMPDLSGLRVLRPGLHMGTLKKNRFEPSHGLALSLKKGDVKRWVELPSDKAQVIRYLKGETLALEGAMTRGDPEGWGLVLTDGLSLGWCKFAGGMIKNHYPKGLRWM